MPARSRIGAGAVVAAGGPEQPVAEEFFYKHGKEAHDLGAAVLGRETLVEDDLVARLVRCVDRIGDRPLTLKPLPGDVRQRRHHLGHFGKHVGRAVVIPRQAHALADLLDDPEILPRVTRRLDHLARELHAAIGRVVDDETLRQELVATGLERAKRYSWPEAAKGHATVYRRALEASG